MYKTNIDDLLDLDDPSNGSEGHGNSYTPNRPADNNIYTQARQMEQQRQMQPRQQQMPPAYQSQQHMYHSPYTQDGISCQRVVEHVRNCPICSKFYNNDNTVYIIIIIVLIILCLLMAKKILQV